MILQALVDYYKRKSADPDSSISPPGFENKDIPFLVQLNREGKFMGIEDTRDKDGKKLKGKIFQIPQAIKRSGSKAPANFLWDNPAYVFGRPSPEKPADASWKKEAFLYELKNRYPQLIENSEIKAVIKFLETDFLPSLEQDPNWQEIVENQPNITFQIAGMNHLVCQHEEVIRAISVSKDTHKRMGTCLITGEEDSISEIHHAIKGVNGSNTSGANFVSFNWDAVESYHKIRGFNSPIGEWACFAYTTALNHLLRSRQKLSFGDSTTIIFWAERPVEMEDLLGAMFDSPRKDDPDRMTLSVKRLYDSYKIGSLSNNENSTRFYVLGISPNAARLSARFWWTGTVRDLSFNLKQYFDDLQIVHSWDNREHFSLYQLIQGLAPQGDVQKVNPRMAGSFLKSIFQGTIFPSYLITSVLSRLKDKEGISHRRVAVIKCWINRFTRHHQILEKEVQVALDEANENVGYRLGRLFAVLEKIQEEALVGNSGSTIRERFYGAASSNPVAIFHRLLKLKNHHLSKLESKGRVVNFEKLIAEILATVTDFPSILSLDDQGRFAIGYYHQRQQFFTKTEK